MKEIKPRINIEIDKAVKKSVLRCVGLHPIHSSYTAWITNALIRQIQYEDKQRVKI